MAHHGKDMHSTGRGGAGNIGEGEGTYTPAGITREGPAGSSGRPTAHTQEYSAGRGGQGNIVPDSRDQPQGSGNSDPAQAQDVVPETATKGRYDDFHTGRGGEGNVHKEKYGGHSKPQKGQEGEEGGLLGKAKHALGMDGKK